MLSYVVAVIRTNAAFLYCSKYLHSRTQSCKKMLLVLRSSMIPKVIDLLGNIFVFTQVAADGRFASTSNFVWCIFENLYAGQTSHVLIGLLSTKKFSSTSLLFHFCFAVRLWL